MALVKETFTLVYFFGLIHCSKREAAAAATKDCEVFCTTDYISQFNCSRTGHATVAPCLVEVNCRNGDDFSNGSCEIRHPEHWCNIKPHYFEVIATIDTNCTTTVRHKEERKESSWSLIDFIKTEPPSNISVEESVFDFNITWSMVNTIENIFPYNSLIYRVRLKPLSKKKPAFDVVTENRKFQIIQKEDLVKGETYAVDIQAKVNPVMFGAVWSEWSHTIELMTEEGFMVTQGPQGGARGLYHQWYFLLLLVMIPVVFLPCAKIWANKLRFRCIPNPRNYFHPLYHSYEGDFKKWVGPILVFSSIDVQEKTPSLKVMCEKNRTSSNLHGKKTEDFCNSVNTHGPQPFLCLPDPNFPNSLAVLGNTINGNISAQHISIDSVTVSEDEVAKMPQEPSAALQGEDGNGNWLNHVENFDIEQISLDSFNSLEYSEDGYPPMKLDLDTVDSGFLESDCSSPIFEPLPLKEVSHSSYVKQWVVGTVDSGQ